MRGLTTTILLVLVLAGLGAYIYFVDSKRPVGGVEDKQKVFTVEADKIQEVTVTSAGETTTLRKQDGAWTITVPVTADADSTEVSNVTSAIAAPRGQSRRRRERAEPGGLRPCRAGHQGRIQG